MYRIDDPSASATLPVPEAALTEGYWTEGNPGTGTPATLERASWFNMIQEELRAIPVAAGLTPSKVTYNQILTALKSMFASVVGSMRNASMSVAAVSATATFTADEIIVETALGGQTFRLASFSKTINLATTGAGGMDTGAAPVSGYVALYAIYNPTTATAALLATNAATLQSNVYGGANMPSGYTASALVLVWPTNASKQFVVGAQIDRKFFNLSGVSIYNANGVVFAYTSVSASGAIPANAKVCGGVIVVSNSASNASGLASICGSTTGVGVQTFNVIIPTATLTFSGSFANVPILTAQTLYISVGAATGTPGANFIITSYDI